MNGYAWELYKRSDDPTQVNNLAKADPAKLEAMKEMFNGKPALSGLHFEQPTPQGWR
jgi:hypothetical protein